MAVSTTVGVLAAGAQFIAQEKEYSQTRITVLQALLV